MNRHQHFIAAIADGLTPLAAYEKAGYKPNASNAFALRTKLWAEIVSYCRRTSLRIPKEHAPGQRRRRSKAYREFQALSANDQQKITSELQENIRLAKQAHRYRDSLNAIELLARLHGIID